MKTVWIVLAVILGLGALCCGGILLTCNKVVGAISEANDAADRFAQKVFQETAKNWDPKVFEQYASPEFKQETTPAQLENYLAKLSKRLGPVQKVGEFTASNTQQNSNNGETTIRVKTSTPTAKFEKGTASVEMTVIKHGDEWSVVNLFVTPHD